MMPFLDLFVVAVSLPFLWFYVKKINSMGVIVMNDSGFLYRTRYIECYVEFSEISGACFKKILLTRKSS